MDQAALFVVGAREVLTCACVKCQLLLSLIIALSTHIAFKKRYKKDVKTRDECRGRYAKQILIQISRG
jgi:hypothetical protein